MDTRSVPHRVPRWPLRQPRPLRQSQQLHRYRPSLAATTLAAAVAGWGALPYFSEFSPSGQLEFNAEFPAGVNTYRAYRQPWFPGGRHAHPRPAGSPG